MTTTAASFRESRRATGRASRWRAGARAPAPTMPAPVRWSFVVLGLLVVAYAVQLALDPVRGESASTALEGFLSNVGMLGAGILCGARAVARREERVAWGLFAGGILAWGIGDLYYTLAFWGVEDAPFPSLADVGYIAFYPAAYAGLVLILRRRLPRVDRLLWIDGLVAALATAALAAAVLFHPVLSSTEGPPATVATNLAYPLGDLVLLSLVVGTLVATGRTSIPAWGWIAAGLAIFSVSDGLFLLATAEGGYVHGALFDAGWNAGAALIALASWWPIRRVERAPLAEGWRTIATPVGFSLVAIGLLLVDHWTRTHVLALGLSAAALVAVLVRLSITFADNVRMVRKNRREALTDSLTGLGNRRLLDLNLRRRLAEAATDHRLELALFDLDGFKQYNDTFGHPAGDALLARLGAKLAAAVAGRGSAYRMGGDEFCVLVDEGGGAGRRSIEAAREALSERGEHLVLSCSDGSVVLPDEATTLPDALRLADQRMNRQKYMRRGSSSRDTTNVLLRALSERCPDLGSHVHDVGELVEATARRLGLPEDELDQVRLAGELHDIGKLAIPDAILSKPGPLTEREWEVIKRHTLIGERIISAAPAMLPVARLVRSSHERVDGDGYPDGLRDEEIPLGARIVFACDAFHAMVSGRPYRASISVDEALDELRRCAGTQFDATVVEALCEVASDYGRGTRRAKRASAALDAARGGAPADVAAAG